MPLKWSSAFCGNQNGLLAQMEKQMKHCFKFYFIFLLEGHSAFLSDSDGPCPRIAFGFLGLL